jgi:DNA-binding MarR family transcriptional regulator
MREGVAASDPAGADVDTVTNAAIAASRLLVAISARSLAAVEGTVTLPQFRLMVVLATRGPMKLVAVAAALAVNPSTALRMVERLAAAGMVERSVNPEMRRESVVRLTPRGRRVVDEVTERRRAEIAAIVARMAPARRRQLVSALRAFAEAGGEPPTADPAPLGWPDAHSP